MINLDYIGTKLSKFGLSETELTAILLENGISPTETLTTESTDLILQAIYKAIPEMLAGLSTVKEGDYSVTWNIQGIKDWYSILAINLGLENKLVPTFKVVDRW